MIKIALFELRLKMKMDSQIKMKLLQLFLLTQLITN